MPVGGGEQVVHALELDRVRDPERRDRHGQLSRGWTCEAGPSKTRPRISDGSMTSYVLSEVISSITGTIADDWTMHKAEGMGSRGGRL